MEYDFSEAKKVYIAETGDNDLRGAKIIKYVLMGDNNKVIGTGRFPVRVCSPFYNFFREVVENKVDVISGEPEDLESRANDPG